MNANLYLANVQQFFKLGKKGDFSKAQWFLQIDERLNKIISYKMKFTIQHHVSMSPYILYVCINRNL